MPTQVDVCSGSAQFSPGEYFEFLSHQTVACTISSCHPPLVNSSYTVPAAVNPGGSTCTAQVQSGASPGTYNLLCDCCGQPQHGPTIIVQA